MTPNIKTFLVNPRLVIVPEEVDILTLLFDWAVEDCNDYNKLKEIVIRNNSHVLYNFISGEVIAYPLHAMIATQLMPLLLEEFRLLISMSRPAWHLIEDEDLKEVILSPEVFYEYFSVHDRFPIDTMFKMYNFIKSKGKSINAAEANKLYKLNPKLVT